LRYYSLIKFKCLSTLWLNGVARKT
jgi:hypothetical protein